MSANRRQILDWVANGHLAADKLEQALTLTNSVLNATSKLRFLSRVILAFAVASLCAGVTFFFAYNWDDLSRFGKFTLAQGALLLSLLPLLRFKLAHPVAQAAIFSASLLLGALLALVGQTYQSGADSYQLFLTWALFIIPWALLARMPALWLLLLALLNLSLVLALDSFALYSLPQPFTHPGWLLFALNFCAAAVWLLISGFLPARLLLRWGQRLINLYSLLIITFLAVGFALSPSHGDILALPVWALFSALWLYIYRLHQLDLVMLSALLMATIVLAIAIVTHALTDAVPTYGLFLVLALLVMGLSSVAALWLKQLSQQADNQAEERSGYD